MFIFFFIFCSCCYCHSQRVHILLHFLAIALLLLESSFYMERILSFDYSCHTACRLQQCSGGGKQKEDYYSVTQMLKKKHMQYVFKQQYSSKNGLGNSHSSIVIGCTGISQDAWRDAGEKQKPIKEWTNRNAKMALKPICILI